MVSAEVAASAAFQAEIALIRAKLAQGSTSHVFQSFDLFATSFERLEVIVDGGAPNQAPTAVDDTATGVEDAYVTIAISDLLANDTDPNTSDTKMLVSVQAPQNGSVDIVGGNVVFTPAANFSGAASFTYTMKDAAGLTSTATVVVNVAAVADVPTLTVADADGAEDSPGIPLVITAASEDGSEVVSVTITGVTNGVLVSAASPGSITANADGSYTVQAGALGDLAFVPAADWSGSLTLSVTATTQDGTSTATSASQQIVIDVAGIADEPVFSGGEDIVTEMTTGTIPLGISVGSGDGDGSETLQLVRIDGVPGGYVLTAGTPPGDDGGGWLVAASDLAALALRPAAAGYGPYGDFKLTITATSTEGATSATQVLELNVTVELPANALSARVQDGYVSGATVFADANRNGELDTGELFATTAADGTFVLIGAPSNAPLVMFGGIDISTGLPFAGKMSAPAGSIVVTPLTTMVAQIAYGSDPNAPAPDNAQLAAAQNAVKAALNLGNVDLTTYDAIAALAGGMEHAQAAAVLSAAIQVQATITQIAAVTDNPAAAVTALAAALSQAAIAETTIVLSDPVAVASVAEDAGVPAAAVSAVTQVVAAANGSIAAATSDTTSAIDVLTTLSQAANVAFGATTDALAEAGTDVGALADVQNDFTGANLDAQVIAAPVGIINLPIIGTLASETLTGTTGTDAIDGLDGDDTLIGLEGNDQLYGGAGRDRLIGGDGDDLLDGGLGADRAIYSAAAQAIDVQLAQGLVTFAASLEVDTLRAVEGVVGTAFADTFNATGFNATSLNGGGSGFTAAGG